MSGEDFSEDQSSGGVALLERAEETVEEISNDDGDHERFSHYVPKQAILDAAVDGKPAVALCGKVWVPLKDGTKYPVCPECEEIYLTMRDE